MTEVAGIFALHKVLGPKLCVGYFPLQAEPFVTQALFLKSEVGLERALCKPTTIARDAVKICS